MRVASRISGTPYTLCELAHGTEVRQRERLAARHVQARLDAHERDAFRGGGEHALQREQVDVALERVRATAGRSPLGSATSTHVPPASSTCARDVVK